MTFAELGLSTKALAALDRARFEAPNRPGAGHLPGAAAAKASVGAEQHDTPTPRVPLARPGDEMDEILEVEELDLRMLLIAI